MPDPATTPITAIRGPACAAPGLVSGVARVYVRDTETGETQIEAAHGQWAITDTPEDRLQRF